MFDIMNYDYSVVQNVLNFIFRNFIIIWIVIFLIAFISGIILLIATWKVYKKAGKPGWTSIVPFYKDYVLAEITWGNGWFFLISLTGLIPVIGVFVVLGFFIISNIKLAKAFGKSDEFAVGLIFLNPVFLAILGFDKSKYIGVDKNINPFTNNDQSNNQNIDGRFNFCSNCGMKLEDNAHFCSNCGTQIR